MENSQRVNYESICRAFAGYPNVTIGSESKRAFGSNALKVNGKIFAMLDSRDRFVVKLPRERVDSLVASGQGERFDPGRGRVMKEWAVIASDAEDEWLARAQEALRFVASA